MGVEAGGGRERDRERSWQRRAKGGVWQPGSGGGRVLLELSVTVVFCFYGYSNQSIGKNFPVRKYWRVKVRVVRL